MGTQYQLSVRTGSGQEANRIKGQAQDIIGKYLGRKGWDPKKVDVKIGQGKEQRKGVHRYHTSMTVHTSEQSYRAEKDGRGIDASIHQVLNSIATQIKKR